MEIHVVMNGDTVESIANQYGVSVQRLIYDNQINMQQNLVIGQALLILIPRIVHRVAMGETLSSISSLYEVSVGQILRNNPYLVNQSYLFAGQSIVIAYEGEAMGSLEVKGYAYPFIQEPILEEALLYLDELLVFSYGFTTMGELIPPQNAHLLVQKAWEFGVEPILVLTPFSEFGTFNNQLVKLVSEDLEVQQNLIQNLLQTVEEEGYTGVDVDFEFILPEDRDVYVRFIENLTSVMNENGYQVSVALAPKVSADQPGLLYEGLDYGALGAAANSVFLMTYEWGYTYGPPMAVAPIDKVKQVLDYAVTEIPPEKIFMGIPNYGYDWALPYERGVTRATNIGNVEAVQIALANGVPIQFDTVAMSPYFTYERDGIQHEVWFEDARSIREKIRVANEYGFRGIGYWSLMKEFRVNWLLLNNINNMEV